MHDEAQRLQLIELAEASILEGLRGEEPAVDLSAMPDWALVPRATFVTVYLKGELNGCIGTLEPRRSLAADVVNNARRAAFNDPRFPAIVEKDLDDVSVHIAILGPLTAVSVEDESELIEEMRVGVDGIVLADGRRRGTFLPAVWDALPDPCEFLSRLKQKTGIRADEWPASMEVFRFQVEEFDRAGLQRS